MLKVERVCVYSESPNMNTPTAKFQLHLMLQLHLWFKEKLTLFYWKIKRSRRRLNLNSAKTLLLLGVDGYVYKTCEETIYTNTYYDLL